MVRPENYFPLQKLVSSKLYSTIPYDKDSDLYTIYEVKLGVDKISIDDGFL